ncbi:hypothetical protein [Ilumatobacter coccineus]|uniref:Uncharacterized protein n=1 Tax=Ilumatobacter coccineus (strain NBRC 103263 / KCTC 29153 / YM16-304) TaxID=1313172 RepID=A0A6C7ECG8_ILUCY|nr:hypothetical protein [Ilumatobacter coccineus]BAN02869.1 hypothetical protein YM304_25550 [Ilumatobacter coccineus YM16-304]
MSEDGTCPKCGMQLEAPQSGALSSSRVAESSDEKAPWHFKLMVASVAIYLGWRVIQLFA